MAKSELRKQYDGLSEEVDELHKRLTINPRQSIAQQINKKLEALGNVVADMNKAGEVDFEEAAELIRPTAWVRVSDYA